MLLATSWCVYCTPVERQWLTELLGVFSSLLHNIQSTHFVICSLLLKGLFAADRRWFPSRRSRFFQQQSSFLPHSATSRCESNDRSPHISLHQWFVADGVRAGGVKPKRIRAAVFSDYCPLLVRVHDEQEAAGGRGLRGGRCSGHHVGAGRPQRGAPGRHLCAREHLVGECV